MDIDLVMIFGFIITILAMLSFGVGKLVNRTMDYRERMSRREAPDGVPMAHYRKLEERVRVLERIATDGNHALASQIENLRDLQELDELYTKGEKQL